MAKWPCLVLPRFCQTMIEVIVESEELNEFGEPTQLLNWKGKCNYQDKAQRIYNADKSYIDVTGCCLIPGDILPNVDIIPSGKVIINNKERIMFQGSKARNPDGSVNYTQLNLR